MAHNGLYSSLQEWPSTAILSGTALALLVTLLVWEYASPSLKGLKRVPDAAVWPLIGDTTRFSGDGEKLSLERYERYGSVFSTWLLGTRTTFVGSQDVMKWLLNKEHDLVEGNWPTSTKKMLGYGSVTVVTGERHLQLRKLMKPAFSVSGISDMVPKLAAIAEQCLDSWAEEGQVKGMLAAKEFTFRVILELVLGMDEERLTPELLERCHAAFEVLDEHLFSFPMNLPGFGFRKGMQARKVLADIAKENIAYIREQQSRNGKSAGSGSCAEELCMELDKGEVPMTIDNMADIFINLLFAGHDTSAHTIAHMLAELPRQPHVWEQLKKEQDAVIQEHGPAITAASLKAMTYLDVFLKESQRLYPIVGGVFRRALRGFELPGGFYVPKGRQIFLNLGHTLKYDERWEGEKGQLNPQQFYPERWLSEEGQKTGAFMPFGGGLRMCVGYLLAQSEMKVFIAALVRGYTYAPEDVNERWTNWPVGGHPVNGLPLRIKKL